MKQCVFCGSTKNVSYLDPERGPVCLNCWVSLGEEWEATEAREKSQDGKKASDERDIPL
jgi:recombinational DNA repair protein (RecF pathway)